MRTQEQDVRLLRFGARAGFKLENLCAIQIGV